MAEPEIIITENEFSDRQSLDAGNHKPDLDEEPEFELEEEPEFLLEEDTVPEEKPIPELTSSQTSTPTFDTPTLENLLTEPQVPGDIEDSFADADIETLESDSIETDVSENDTVSESHDNAKSPRETLTPNTGYSDDILSFPNARLAASEPEGQSKAESLQQQTPALSESDEKIDFTETVAIEHKPGTLHVQQAQQIELSILERIDDLIHVLHNKSKTKVNPEQLPHKQFATGIHYIKHEENHYLGAKWLRKAAMQGHAKAQLYLGMLFVQGKGVPKSLFHAYAWFSLAVCQDIDEAKDARKKLELHLTAKEINASLKYAADLLDRIQL